MPPTLVSRVALRFAVVVAFMIPAAICSCLSTAWFIKISAQVEHSHEFLDCLKDLRSLLKDAESGQRGFLLTGGKAEYLRPYDDATTAIGPKLSELAALAERALPPQ